jgi:hypothetical protein
MRSAVASKGKDPFRTEGSVGTGQRRRDVRRRSGAGGLGRGLQVTDGTAVISRGIPRKQGVIRCPFRNTLGVVESAAVRLGAEIPPVVVNPEMQVV